MGGIHQAQFSIVIVTRDGRQRLGPCLESLAAAPIGTTAEVIVVDNGSRDPLGPWLTTMWPEARLIELGSNRGFSVAANIGAQEARGEIVIFLNDDTVVAPGWSGRLIDVFSEFADVVIAGGLTLFQSRPSVVNTAGTGIALSGAGKDIGIELPRTSIDSRPRDVPGVSGVSMAVRREWFLDSGGFDPGFFMYFEDTDLCLRAWLEGFRVRFVPESAVLHAFGGTAGNPLAQWRYYYGSRNRWLIVFKSYDPVHLVLAWTLSLVQDIAVVVIFLMRGRFRQALVSGRGKLGGTLAAVRALPSYCPARRFARGRRRRSIWQLRRLGVIDPLTLSLREFVRLRRFR